VPQYIDEGELILAGGSEDTHRSPRFRGLLDRMHLFTSNLDLHDELSRTSRQTIKIEQQFQRS
jgi:hypothetical protein